MSSATQITAAVIQLLSEDIRTDGLTDVAKLRCATLNVITQTALQLLQCCKSAGRHRKLQHNVSDHWPCRSKVQRAAEKENLITVHILTAHPIFISSLFGHKTKNKKIFQNER